MFYLHAHVPLYFIHNGYTILPLPDVLINIISLLVAFDSMPLTIFTSVRNSLQFKFAVGLISSTICGLYTCLAGADSNSK